eukprot:INCI5277.1.p1 GENE.INCI5277.1~~INCI5277.1.p1  ORF type:complete len:452 (+),score=85.39 INCI5277.1:192-1547(+)
MFSKALGVLLACALASKCMSLVLEPSVLVSELDPFGPPIQKDDDGVASLTSENFDAFVRSKPMTVVAFIAPWCGFCKKLKPEFAQVALDVEKEFPDTMHFARVDCVAESQLYDRFDIESYGFPAIFLFHFGKLANVYQSRDLSQSAIRDFYREWAMQPDVHTGWLFAETIDDVYNVLEYDTERRVYTSPIPTLLTLFDPARINSDDSRMVLEALANASFKYETKHTRFVVTTDPLVMDVFMQITEDCGLQEPPTDLPVSRLITSYDKPDVFLPPAMVRLADMLAAFVHSWAWPDLVVHNGKNMTYMFTERPGFQNHVLVFADGPPGTPGYKTLYDAALRVGGFYRKKLIVAIVSPDNPAGKAIAQALAVTEPLPAIRIVSSNAKATSPGDKVQRYRYAGNDEFSAAAAALSLQGPDAEKNLLDYVQKFISGQLTPVDRKKASRGGAVEREL